MRRTKLPAKTNITFKPYYLNDKRRRNNISFRKEAGPAIYFLIKDEEIVYIGQTKDMGQRAYGFYHQHGSDSFDTVGIYRPSVKDVWRAPWWNKGNPKKDIERYLREFLLDIESYFIRAYQPKLNKRERSFVGQRKHTTNSTPLTNELEWLKDKANDWISRCNI